MSGPINQPGSLLAAQIVSYNKGQELQSKESAEEREKKRLLNLQLQQIGKQQQLKKPNGAGKGILA